MSNSEVRSGRSATGAIQRRGLLRGAAALAASGVALASHRPAAAQAADSDARWFLSGKLMPGGHSFQESHPQETVAELRAFLG